jgi:leader peptidase (prepilin peptidase)/N-methyltransferase
MTVALIFGCTLLGLVVGSFLNVVIHRIPLHLSVVSPRSNCPNCATPIAMRDNVPVLSWLVLHGHCRSCHAPISARYLGVELLTAVLFASTAARLGAVWALPAFLMLVAGLIALACTDLEHQLLPLRIVYPVLGLVGALLLLAAVATDEWGRLLTGVIAGLVWSALFFTINAASPRVLGFGDVRLVLLIGLGLGWLGVGEVAIGFFAANLIGAAIGVGLLATRRATRSTPVPYGVFLAAGAMIALFSGPSLLAHYRFG